MDLLGAGDNGEKGQREHNGAKVNLIYEIRDLLGSNSFSFGFKTRRAIGGMRQAGDARRDVRRGI
jgi:hypothetical protein